MLIVTRDATLIRQVEELLVDTELDSLNLSDRAEIDALFEQNPPQIGLIDMNIGKDEALAICTHLRKKAGGDKLALLVLVGETDDATLSNLLSAGTDGLVSRSLKPLSFKARISAHLSRITATKKLALKVHDSEVLIDITSRLVGSTDVLDNLYDVAISISKELDVDRCSVVLVRPQRDFGLVVASSDNPNLRSLAINLQHYPEIASAVDKGSPLIISDITENSLLTQVLPSLLDAGVASVALFPIARQDEALGVIFLRFMEKREMFEEREIVFCQTVANAASIALRNAEILELLKEKTREIEKVQTEAQVQLRSLKRYEDFFIGALDGMVAIEQSGRIVFVNPKASTMMKAEASAVVGKSFADFLIPDEKAAFVRLLDEFVRGEARSSVDFRLQCSQDKEPIMSISAGSLFGEEGMMLLTIRDVTDEREMEQRLAMAQNQLVESEKQAAMAQLAGAAAHELNQPLTSVMTSIAMLRRLLDKDSTKQKIINTIEQESERMASIIRRLTEITSFTSKHYVGKAKIIDLNDSHLDESGEEGDR